MGAVIPAAGDLGLDDQIIGMVGAGHVPLLAVDPVVRALAPRRGGDGVDIGPGAGFGDGVAFAARAADGRSDPGLHLVRRRDLVEAARRRVHAPAKAIGRAANLFRNDGLFEKAETAAAGFLGHVHGAQAEPRGLGLGGLFRARRKLALVQFGVDLVRDQIVVDERPGSFLQRTHGFRQGIGHSGLASSGAGANRARSSESARPILADYSAASETGNGAGGVVSPGPPSSSWSSIWASISARAPGTGAVSSLVTGIVSRIRSWNSRTPVS